MQLAILDEHNLNAEAQVALSVVEHDLNAFLVAIRDETSDTNNALAKSLTAAHKIIMGKKLNRGAKGE